MATGAGLSGSSIPGHRPRAAPEHIDPAGPPQGAASTPTPAATLAPASVADAGRGLAMGLSDVVPGVSGGTIALLLGIHPRIVAAIRSIDWGLLGALWVLLTVRLGRPGRADEPHASGVGPLGGAATDARQQARLRWQRADTGFLLLVVAGLGCGIIAGALVVERLIEKQPVALAAFFIGLIIASVPVPYRMMPTRGAVEVVAFLLAGAAAFYLTTLQRIAAPEALWFLPIAGAIAICAMILPGISGAFLLLLMGLYEPVIHSVAHLEIMRLLLFGGGALVGIAAFSRVLHRLLQYKPGPTLAALIGLMLGSLGLLWPFKSGGEFAAGHNVLPEDPSAWLVAVLAAVLGAGVAWLLGRAAQRSTPAS
jgi:putative membrane protein